MSLTNEAGISFDGTDLSGPTIGLYVTSPNSPRLPKPRLDIQNLGAGDGAAIQGTSYDPMVFSFSCKLAGSSPATRETQVSALETALEDAQDGEAELILGWRPTKYWNVRLSSGLDTQEAINGAEFNLSFIAGDPWPKDIV